MRKTEGEKLVKNKQSTQQKPYVIIFKGARAFKNNEACPKPALDKPCIQKKHNVWRFAVLPGMKYIKLLVRNLISGRK